MPRRNVVVCRAPEDSNLAAALHRELAVRGTDGWPAGPAITAEYASAELIVRLAASDGLVVLATPAAIAWPFAVRAMRFARELSRGVLILAMGVTDDRLRLWLRQSPVQASVRACADAVEAALAVERWSPPAADGSPPVVQFAAARAELLRVASHGGRVAELVASGIDAGSLRTAALHLRGLGLIDFAGPLDDERTSFITVS